MGSRIRPRVPEYNGVYREEPGNPQAKSVTFRREWRGSGLARLLPVDALDCIKTVDESAMTWTASIDTDASHRRAARCLSALGSVNLARANTLPLVLSSKATH
jgi:hypothetical protein